MRLQSLPQPLSASPRHVALRLSSLIVVLLALVAASLVTLMNTPRALACPVCIAPDKITLSGDGITGTASVTNPSILASFGAADFMGFEQRAPIVEPAHTGAGIELTRYFNNSGVPASFWTQGFDHMRYFPSTAGQPGYILYEGPVSAEASHYATGLDMSQRAGKWFRLTADEDQAISQLLAAAHASPQNSQASSPPAPFTSPSSSQPPAILAALAAIPLPVIILLACMLLLVASVGFRLIQTRHHRQAPFGPAQDSAD